MVKSYGVVAHEILLSYPGTGGTLYSIFYSQVPSPKSQVPSPSRLTKNLTSNLFWIFREKHAEEVDTASGDFVKFTRPERIVYVAPVTQIALLGDIRRGNKGRGDFVTVRSNVHSETIHCLTKCLITLIYRSWRWHEKINTYILMERRCLKFVFTKLNFLKPEMANLCRKQEAAWLYDVEDERSLILDITFVKVILSIAMIYISVVKLMIFCLIPTRF